MARRSTSSRKRKSTRKRSTSSRRTSGGSSSSRRGSRLTINLDAKQKGIVIGIGLIFLTAVIALSLLSPNQGQLTTFLSDWMWKLFGWGGAVVAIVLGLSGFYLVLWGMDQPPRLPGLRLVGFFFVFLSLEAFISLIFVAQDNGLHDVTAVAEAGQGGGYFGGAVVWLLTQGIGRLGTIFVLLVVGLIAAVLATGISREELGMFIQRLFSRTPEESERPQIPVITNRSRRTGQGSATPGQTTTPVTGSFDPEPTVTATPVAGPSESNNRAGPVADQVETRRRRGRARSGKQSKANEDGSQDQVIAPTPVFLNQNNDHIWELPELAEMLNPGSEQDFGDAYIREQVEIIEDTLESFGAPAKVVEINQGPTITQYGVEPSFIELRSGKRTKVKVGKIASLADDLTLALAARSIRIQAPVPGKGYVGIEVPNSEKALVSLRDVMESGEFHNINSALRIGLGQNVAGQPIATDLAQMPHLLIAGTTGSGKSVCVNSVIASLLLQNTPENLKLVMVDPKRVELTGYNGVPHLVAPVVVDLDRVVGTLQWAMREMDNRYKRLADAGARNIVEFNKKQAANGRDHMAYIVIIIDELADLMMLSPEETERGITRLAQMARATGIHMVIATQRPSVDVVTGLIKANFPARIAFAVASSTDSRVILDTTGAERLLGQGDMLFQSPDAAAPIRLQGCWVSPGELTNIINYWQTARRLSRSQGKSETLAVSGDGEIIEVEAQSEAEPAEPAAEQPPLWEDMREEQEKAAKYADELLPEAIALVRELNKASTSLLQRRFRIGYTRAARLMDVMEEDGIIGPPTGTSKARKVMPYEETDEDDPTSDRDSTRDKEVTRD